MEISSPTSMRWGWAMGTTPRPAFWHTKARGWTKSRGGFWGFGGGVRAGEEGLGGWSKFLLKAAARWGGGGVGRSKFGFCGVAKPGCGIAGQSHESLDSLFPCPFPVLVFCHVSPRNTEVNIRGRRRGVVQAPDRVSFHRKEGSSKVWLFGALRA